MLPENCVAVMDVHKATALYDESIQFENMDLVMVLTALSKGVAYGLLLNRRVASGDMPEYERVGFINGLDAIGVFAPGAKVIIHLSQCLQRTRSPRTVEESRLSLNMLALREVR